MDERPCCILLCGLCRSMPCRVLLSKTLRLAGPTHCTQHCFAFAAKHDRCRRMCTLHWHADEVWCTLRDYPCCQGSCINDGLPGRLSCSSFVATTSPLLLAGDMVAAQRPAAEVASFCKRLPGLWLKACADVYHTCLSRVIVEHDSPEEVTVPLDSRNAMLPNIHP